MILENRSTLSDAAIRLSFGYIVMLNPDGVIISFDRYIDQIPDQEAVRMIGRKWAELFVPVDEGSGGFNPGAVCDNSGDGPLKVLTVYGENTYIEWKFSQLKGSVPGRNGILGAGIDVTSHVELKQQLLHADRLATVGQLAAGIAHEINGPVNNILGYAQLAAKQQDLPEQVYQDLDNIVRMSLHAREVVKKVMLFSRQVPPKRDRIRLNQVIRESLYFTEPLCGKNNIRITCCLDPDLPELKGDFSQLRQVVVNLVVNAAQAMPDQGGEIDITTRHGRPGEVTLAVRDTGTGMTEATLSQCFVPFFTTKEVEEGTGLGLSVVHGIIRAHDADIEVTSRSGEGTCFTVTFPAPQGNGE